MIVNERIIETIDRFREKSEKISELRSKLADKEALLNNFRKSLHLWGCFKWFWLCPLLIYIGVIMSATAEEGTLNEWLVPIVVLFVPAFIILIVTLVRVVSELKKYFRSRSKVEGVDRSAIEKEIKELRNQLDNLTYYSGRKLGLLERDNGWEQLSQDFCHLLFIVPEKDGHTYYDFDFLKSNWLAKDIMERYMAGLFDDTRITNAYTAMDEALLTHEQWVLRLLGVTIQCGWVKLSDCLSPAPELMEYANEMWDMLEEQIEDDEDYSYGYELIGNAKEVSEILGRTLSKYAQEEYIKRKAQN